MSQSACRQRW